MDTYFSKFPTISYNNSTAIDITRRVAVSNNTLLNPYLFSPTTIDKGQRSDQLARQYYSDPYQEWALFLTNNIIDPYSSWYMSQNEFDDFIIQKYGSITLPQQKVKYYKNNWSLYPGAIDLSTYDSLDISLIKYYEPLFDGNGIIYAYVRTQKDWTINTNHLVSYICQNTIPTFVDDEIVNVVFDANSSGNAQVVSCSNNILNIQHVIGYYQPPTGYINANSFSITGTISGSVLTVNSSNSITYNSFNTLSNEEMVYYNPITYYSYEYDLNESNKIINIMQSNYVPTLSKNLAKALLS
jgi:hypothetical protein